MQDFIATIFILSVSMALLIFFLIFKYIRKDNPIPKEELNRIGYISSVILVITLILSPFVADKQADAMKIFDEHVSVSKAPVVPYHLRKPVPFPQH